jgi:hypothetical protein
MKKAWIFLIVAAFLAFSVPVFAQQMAAPAGPTVTFSGTFVWLGNYDPSITAAGVPPTANGGATRIWPTADIHMDPNNTLEIGLRLSNGELTNGSVADLIGNMNTINGSLWHFDWTSDLTKAAGMTNGPVDISLTIGLMDTVFTDWWYDNNGWEWEYGGWSKAVGNNWDAGLTTINEDSNYMGWQLNVKGGPLTFEWASDFALQNEIIGVDAEFMGAGVFVSYAYYGNEMSYGSTQSEFNVEAKYEADLPMGLKLKPSIFFRDALNPANWVFGVDFGIVFQMFELVLGGTTTSDETLQHYSATVIVNATDMAQVFVGAYFDGSTPDSAPLQAIDIGATYKFGSCTLAVGWVVGGSDQTNNTADNQKLDTNGGNNVTIMNNDTTGGIRDGLYFGTNISF